MTTLKLFKQFEIELELKLSEFPEHWGKIVRIGHKTLAEYGSRNPAIAFYQTTLRFTNAVNGENQYMQNLKPAQHGVKVNEWIQLKATQLLSENGEYVYRIYVDGDEKHSIVNNQTIETIEDAEIWLSSSYGDPADGKVRNFRFVSHDCPASSFFDGQKCVGMF